MTTKTGAPRNTWGQWTAGNPDSLAKATEASPPETCAVKHGLYLSTTTGAGLMTCDKCACQRSCPEFHEGGRCRLEGEYIIERRRQLARAVRDSGGDPALAGTLIESAVVAEVRLGRLCRYLAEQGELLGGADRGYLEYQPAARELPRLQATVRESLEVLNLTPRALAKLKMQQRASRPDLLGVLLAAKALEEGEGKGEEAEDADFTEDEGEGEEGED